MNQPRSHRDGKPDKTLLSSIVLVLGAFMALGSTIALFFGGWGFTVGLIGWAIAAVLLALSRALDYLHESVERLRRIEDRLREEEE